jgi:hypothetical protein
MAAAELECCYLGNSAVVADRPSSWPCRCNVCTGKQQETEHGTYKFHEVPIGLTTEELDLVTGGSLVAASYAGASLSDLAKAAWDWVWYPSEEKFHPKVYGSAGGVRG